MNFDQIEYPAFIVVYGPSKEDVSFVNSYPETCKSQMCFSEKEADSLVEQYNCQPGDLEIYVVPRPNKMQRVYLHGGLCEDFDLEEYKKYD